MTKKFLILFFGIYSYAALNAYDTAIIIRPALITDLPALLEFDTRVSYEYFIPLYNIGYSHLPVGKDPYYYLDAELEKDEAWFRDCIEGDNPEQLLLARDTTDDTIAGLIIAHQASQISMELDLLLVAKEYRRKGIGRALVQSALAAFPEVAVCEVYPLRYANDASLAFYESLGFVNQGVPRIDKLNMYGVPYKEMYYYFTYQIRTRLHTPTRAYMDATMEHVQGIR